MTTTRLPRALLPSLLLLATGCASTASGLQAHLPTAANAPAVAAAAPRPVTPAVLDLTLRPLALGPAVGGSPFESLAGVVAVGADGEPGFLALPPIPAPSACADAPEKDDGVTVVILGGARSRQRPAATPTTWTRVQRVRSAWGGYWDVLPAARR